jgi:transcriptional regulator with XRE-family HTH domain
LVIYIHKNHYFIQMWPLKTKIEIATEIANRCRDLRLEQNLSQEELAKRSGIALRTYRRFEQEGSISLERLIGVIQSLNRISELETILRPSPFEDLDQIENPKAARNRSRSR